MMFTVRLPDSKVEALELLAKRGGFANTSALARNIFDGFIQKNRGGLVRELVCRNVEGQNMTQTVTVSFIPADNRSCSAEAAYHRLKQGSVTNRDKKRLPLFERDQPDGDRMVRAYMSAMAKKFRGGGNLPAIAVCETMKKNGVDSTYLHYHCLLDITERQERHFAEATADFWRKIGIRHFGQPIYSDVERAKSPEAALRYALKSVDNDYPLDRIIMVGF